MELDMSAVYAEGLLTLSSRDGQDVRTLPLDTFDPVDAMELMELGFGNPGQVEGLGVEALDDALARNGWQRLTDWSQDPQGPSATVRRVEG